jgi:hypothetical protein
MDSFSRWTTFTITYTYNPRSVASLHADCEQPAHIHQNTYWFLLPLRTTCTYTTPPHYLEKILHTAQTKPISPSKHDSESNDSLASLSHNIVTYFYIIYSSTLPACYQLVFSSSRESVTLGLFQQVCSVDGSSLELELTALARQHTRIDDPTISMEVDYLVSQLP